MPGGKIRIQTDSVRVYYINQFNLLTLLNLETYSKLTFKEMINVRGEVEEICEEVEELCEEVEEIWINKGKKNKIDS